MKSFTRQKCQIEYFDIGTDYSYENLGKCILKYMNAQDLSTYNPVILCIGTDRATGDCLGPLVGEQLQTIDNRYKVFGTLSNPVHALNIRDVIEYININIDNPYIIAIDASLGDSDHVGHITVSDCPIFPGKGVNKKLPAIGDLSITGIVNLSGQSPSLLQSTRLYTVMQLANCIADALIYSVNHLDDFCPL